MKQIRGPLATTALVACLAALLVAANNDGNRSAARTSTLCALRIQASLAQLLNTDLDREATIYRIHRGEFVRNLHDLGDEARQPHRYLVAFEDAVQHHAEALARLDEQSAMLDQYFARHNRPQSQLAFLDTQVAVKDFRLYRHLSRTHQARVPGGALLTDIRQRLDRLEKRAPKAQRFRIVRYREAFESAVASLHAAESAMHALRRDAAARVAAAHLNGDDSVPPARLLQARALEQDWRRTRAGWWSPQTPSPLAEIQKVLDRDRAEARDYLDALDRLDRFWRSEARLAFPLIEAHGRTLEQAVPARLQARVTAGRLKLLAKDYMLSRLTGLAGLRASGLPAPSPAGQLGRWQAALEAVPVGANEKAQQARADYRAALQDLARTLKKENRILNRIDHEAGTLEHRLKARARPGDVG